MIELFCRIRQKKTFQKIFSTLNICGFSSKTITGF